jgi:ATP-dependent Zn protease
LPNRIEFSILDKNYQRARRILEEKCSILKTLAQLLPEKEVISGKEIQKLVHKQEQLR